jgi:iron complex outermembrane receptor protein
MRTYLLAGACIIALSVAGAANAQNVATAQTAEQDVPQSQEHDIVVTAHTNRTNMAGGGMIAIQDAPVVRTTIGQGFIAKQMPAQNALAAVRLAPGANVGQDNPYGISERSDLTVRGMNQSQMGFVLEGMPLGDPNNYLPNTNEWIDNENIKSVTLTQGTSDLSSPVLSASGGLIQVNMRDPSEEMGGTVSASIGSFNAYRGFARLETGNIANTGIRIAGSYSFINADNFRGAASSRREHIDVKALKEFDNGSRVALIWTNNDFVNYRSTIVNLNQWNTAGKHQDYTADYTFGSTAYNKFYPFYRRANFVQAPSKIVLNDNVTLDVTPYYRNMQPNGPGGVNLPTSGLYNGTTRYAETLSVPYSVNGRFVAEAMSNINEQQAGVNASITWKTGHHEITAGIWYDRFWERALSKYVGVDQFGQANDRGDDYLTFSDGTVLSSTNFRLNRTAVALYANDTVSLLDDKLKLMFGFKQLFIDVTGDNYLPGATAKVGVHQTKSMPRFGATYSFGDNHQVFFDLVTNARPPAPGPSYMDVFSVTTGAKTTTGNQNTKMEYSFLQEIGYRYQGFVNFSIAGFHNKLTNHQVNTIVVQDGVMTQSQIAAGGKTIWGANVEVGLRPWHNFSPYVSGQYLHATTDDDLPVGNDYLPTKGKIAVRSPKFMGAAGITYDDGSLFSVITFRHVGSQYSTFMTDQKMAAYNTLDFGIGYRLPDIGPMKRPTVQVNLTNLTEGAYLGAIASPTGASKATVGRNGTVIAASQPGYYMNSGFVAMGSIRTDF